MVTLTVLCEGTTEVNFVTRVLRPHLEHFGVRVKHTNMSGGLSWARLKAELNRTLKSRRHHEWATTMFDLYRLMRVPDCPNLAGRTGVEKAIELEQAMGRGLPNSKLVPHIQVHEFEALLYVDLTRLESAFPDGEAKKAIPVLQAETQGLHPEEINEGELTTPSKRLIREIPAYKRRKSTAGPQVAERIGLPVLRQACPHFHEWLTHLEGLGG